MTDGNTLSETNQAAHTAEAPWNVQYIFTESEDCGFCPVFNWDCFGKGFAGFQYRQEEQLHKAMTFNVHKGMWVLY